MLEAIKYQEDFDGRLHSLSLTPIDRCSTSYASTQRYAKGFTLSSGAGGGGGNKFQIYDFPIL